MSYALQKKEERLKAKEFLEAINNLARRLGAALEAKPTPISTFKARYSGILREADHGKVQMISQGSKRYVLLTEMQLVEIMGMDARSKSRSLADTLETLTPPKERLDTRAVLLAGSEHDPFTLPESAH